MTRMPTPRQQAWLWRGVGLGGLAVLLLQVPSALALWAWWQREPLPPAPLPAAPSAVTPTMTSAVASPAAMPTLERAPHWQALLDERAAATRWQALRERLDQQGLAVQTWQRLEGRGPENAWPLAVQRARLVVQSGVLTWPVPSASDAPAGGLWRLDRLQGQVQDAAAGKPVWRWQAEWSLALRPANPGDAADPAAVLPAQGTPAAALASLPARALPGDARRQVQAAPPVAADTAPATEPRVRGEGLLITDWPLAQLQWAGLWHSEGRQEALFAAPGRLFRVRPGEAVGQDGHRWVGGDAHRLLLQLPTGTGREPPQGAPAAQDRQLLIWKARP